VEIKVAAQTIYSLLGSGWSRPCLLKGFVLDLMAALHIAKFNNCQGLGTRETRRFGTAFEKTNMYESDRS